MSARFTKLVKNARRGKALSKKFRRHFWGVFFAFCSILLGSTWLVWQQEEHFQGTFLDTFWSVLFTLIGQGEFATAPQTFVGKIVVFFLSIVGVALFGVIFSELVQRLMNNKLRELMGMNRCKFLGHVIICGWNARAAYVVRELLASDREVAVVAKERPADLHADVFFVAGSSSDKETLLRAGLSDATAVILLSAPGNGDDDSKTILTGLAVKSANPDVYAVMELHDPENERYARFAKVDDIIYSDSLIADITSTCTKYEGISSFIRDILSSDDEGHCFAAYDVEEAFGGKTIGELFADCKQKGLLPIGVIVPPEKGDRSIVSLWHSRVNPDENEKIRLPMKVVCIQKN